MLHSGQILSRVTSVKHLPIRIVWHICCRWGPNHMQAHANSHAYKPVIHHDSSQVEGSVFTPPATALLLLRALSDRAARMSIRQHKHHPAVLLIRTWSVASCLPHSHDQGGVTLGAGVQEAVGTIAEERADNASLRSRLDSLEAHTSLQAEKRGAEMDRLLSQVLPY